MKLDSSVLIPPKATGRPRVYPFAEMQIGQSFEVAERQAKTARAATWKWKKTHPGWDYTTRTTEHGLRIWRTA